MINIIKFKIGAISLLMLIFSTISVKAREPDNALTITHIADMPNGNEQILSVEVIKNINDLYFYTAEQSPVASKLLKSGYSLKDEKNKVIEADVVSNGGNIELKYTPAVQKVRVTYYEEKGDGTPIKIGTFEDYAYVGQKYKPYLPAHESENEEAKKADTDFTVEYGENDFTIFYKDDEKIGAEVSKGLNLILNGKGAPLVNITVHRDKGYAVGYNDSTFKPDKKISKGELFSMLHHILGGNKYDIESSASYLAEIAVIDQDELKKLSSSITWDEFYGYADKINSKLVNDKLVGIDRSIWKDYAKPGSRITRAQAVTAINSMINKKNNHALLPDNKYNDVFEDHWAYFEILKATED